MLCRDLWLKRRGETLRPSEMLAIDVSRCKRTHSLIRCLSGYDHAYLLRALGGLLRVLSGDGALYRSSVYFRTVAGRQDSTLCLVVTARGWPQAQTCAPFAKYPFRV